MLNVNFRSLFIIQNLKVLQSILLLNYLFIKYHAYKIIPNLENSQLLNLLSFMQNFQAFL